MPQVFDWPDALRPASVSWGLFVPQQVGRSAFDGSIETDLIGAPQWEFTITTGAILRTELPAWEAFFDKLDGSVNRVRCGDWRREGPLGVASGAPVVRVAALGASLALEGWTPSVAGILQAGSYLGINGELKRLSSTVSSDGLGRCTVAFKPPMRALPPVGTPIILVKPTATFYLVGSAPSWEQSGARFPSQTLKFREDVA